MVGHTLRVVAGGGGDDSAFGFFGGEEAEAVERSAFFEGAGHLQVFELEIDLLAGEFGEHLGAGAGGGIDLAEEALACGEDVGQIYGQRHRFRVHACSGPHPPRGGWGH